MPDDDEAADLRLPYPTGSTTGSYMSTAAELQRIVQAMSHEVREIRDFVVHVHGAIESTEPVAAKSALHAGDSAELRRIAAQLLTGADRLSQGDDVAIAIHVDSERIGAFMRETTRPLKQRQMLAEMAVSHLVAHLEAFVKDYLSAVLSGFPNTLRSKATITIEEVLEFGDVKALYVALAKKEVDSLGRGGIDDIDSFFKRKFNITSEQFSSWKELRELVYRRNLIVHNLGVVNDTYRQKVGYKRKSNFLNTDLNYVAQAANTILDYFSFVHAAVQFKFKLR